jgi:hypothetical protein
MEEYQTALFFPFGSLTTADDSQKTLKEMKFEHGSASDRCQKNVHFEGPATLFK